MNKLSFNYYFQYSKPGVFLKGIEGRVIQLRLFMPKREFEIRDLGGDNAIPLFNLEMGAFLKEGWGEYPARIMRTGVYECSSTSRRKKRFGRVLGKKKKQHFDAVYGCSH